MKFKEPLEAAAPSTPFFPGITAMSQRVLQSPEAHIIPVQTLYICDHQSCARGFPTMSGLNYHKRSCVPSRKRMLDALPAARELFMQRKKARTLHIQVRRNEWVELPNFSFNLPQNFDNHENASGSSSTHNIAQALPSIGNNPIQINGNGNGDAIQTGGGGNSIRAEDGASLPAASTVRAGPP
ncbi:hypothetical protein DXG01_015503 [Tephrocybe rancida]|nr:hypothetical protein DXG01_015503 [Tephrocybe rancida]